MTTVKPLLLVQVESHFFSLSVNSYSILHFQSHNGKWSRQEAFCILLHRIRIPVFDSAVRGSIIPFMIHITYFSLISFSWIVLEVKNTITITFWISADDLSFAYRVEELFLTQTQDGCNFFFFCFGHIKKIQIASIHLISWL